MKKTILILSILLISCGCNRIKEKNIEKPINEEIIENYIDDNPIKIGIYDNEKLVHNYETNFIPMNDLAVFNILYTNEEIINYDRVKINWQKYYNTYENVENYKTGFYISFIADNTKQEALILDITHEYVLSPYLYIYIYDDVNQDDFSWYSHITQEDYNDNTIFSSIKLFLTDEEYKITSPITLTVFTYNDKNDFDSNNHYRGNSSYTIEINRKN